MGARSLILLIVVGFLGNTGFAANNESGGIQVRSLSQLGSKKTMRHSDLRCGTGVGSCEPGTGGSFNEYVEQLKRRWQGKRASVNSPMDQVMRWSRSAVQELQAAKGRALDRYREAKYEEAFQFLYKVMVVMSQSMSYGGPNLGGQIGSVNIGPMTKQMLDRGVVLASVLDQNFPDQNEVRTNSVAKLDFLSEYIDFLEVVERHFDRDYYIPFQYQHNRCWDQYGHRDRCYDRVPSLREMESQYLRLATKFLKLTEHFLIINSNGYRHRHVEITPLNPATAYLYLVENISNWVAWDYAENLYANTKSCQIDMLDELSQSLYDFNNGSGYRFPNIGWAIHESYRVVNSVVNGDCDYYYNHGERW